MRVYEISKQLGIPTKEVIEALNHEGFNVQSHMASLSEEAITFIEQRFKKPSTEKKVVEKEKVEKIEQPKKEVIQPKAPPLKEEPKPVEVKQKIEIPEKKIVPEEPQALVLTSMTVADFAQKIQKPANEIIVSLLKKGHIYTINQMLSTKIIEQLCEQYGIKTVKPVENKARDFKAIVRKTKGETRLPVIVVVGHVDHGKTTLLDYIRKTKVAAKEKGGITQHLGAYQVDTPQGSLVFLDTPGHEAFTKMRARGLNVADLAILVVAADDSVMPQTIEAIKYAQMAGIPIIVAVNKIDKVGPVQIEKVKRDLAQHDLLPEEWGGQTVVIPISAKEGTGIDNLLEIIVLQTELMELKADEAGPAQGFILEAKIEKGRGPVATIILHQGRINVGDFFVADSSQGKVSSIVDSYGNNLKNVGPSVPVQVAGFDKLPDVGQLFEVVSKDGYKAAKTTKGALEREVKQFVGENFINLIVKTDNKSSKEAITDAIAVLAKRSKKNLNIIYAGVGDITESDISLAHNTNSVIYGFQIKIETNAVLEAQKEDVSIKIFMIIYKLLEDIEQLIQEKVEPKKELVKVGSAEVRKVFDIKNIGVIAGSYVKEGRIVRNGQIVILRNNQKIGQGPIKSLERDRKPVKEVHKGFECAFLVEGFNDWQVDDIAECFITKTSE